MNVTITLELHWDDGDFTTRQLELAIQRMAVETAQAMGLTVSLQADGDGGLVFITDSAKQVGDLILRLWERSIRIPEVEVYSDQARADMERELPRLPYRPRVSQPESPTALPAPRGEGLLRPCPPAPAPGRPEDNGS